MNETAKHLRTIHFSLVAVSFGLFVVSTLGRASDVEVAIDQLSEIEGVIADWSEQWMTTGVRSLIDKGEVELPSFVFGESDRPFEFSVGDARLRRAQEWSLLPLPREALDLASPGGLLEPLDREGPLWTKLSPDPRGLQFLSIIEMTPFVHARPVDLAEFESVWNKVTTLSLTLTWPDSCWAGDSEPVFVGSRLLQRFGAAGNYELVYGPELDLESAGPGSLALILEPLSTSDRDFWNDYTEHQFYPLNYHFVGFSPRSSFGGREVSIPVTTDQSLPIQGYQVFRDVYGIDWPPGPFARAFPELSRSTQGLSELDFSTTRAVLEGEALESEDQIEVFGATIPASSAARWGAPVLIVMQLYFLLHLRALSRAGGQPKEAPAPWIALYRDRLSMVATVISAFGIPVFVAGFLLWQASSPVSALSATVSSLAFVCSVVVALLGLQALREVWKSMERQSVAA